MGDGTQCFAHTDEGASDIFSGVVLIAAGIYQWTPLKDICLRQCQAPWLFIQRHGGFRSDIAGTLGLGMRHGSYCIGCCWVLMALLFVDGVISRTAGAALVGAGVWLLAQAL